MEVLRSDCKDHKDSSAVMLKCPWIKSVVKDDFFYNKATDFNECVSFFCVEKTTKIMLVQIAMKGKEIRLPKR